MSFLAYFRQFFTCLRIRIREVLIIRIRTDPDHTSLGATAELQLKTLNAMHHLLEVAPVPASKRPALGGSGSATQEPDTGILPACKVVLELFLLHGGGHEDELEGGVGGEEFLLQDGEAQVHL